MRNFHNSLAVSIIALTMIAMAAAGQADHDDQPLDQPDVTRSTSLIDEVYDAISQAVDQGIDQGHDGKDNPSRTPPPSADGSTPPSLRQPRVGDMDSSAYVQGSIYVIFSAEATAADMETAHLAAGATSIDWISRSLLPGRMMQVSVTAGEEQVAIDNYTATPFVLAASPSMVRFIDTDPNDDYWGDLWGMKGDGAGSRAQWAWDEFSGSPTMVVGIIDSGINRNHPDLIDNIWVNPDEVPGNGIDDDGNGYIDDVYGWDFAYNDADPFDDVAVCGYHGSHVAGTIGARGNNSEGVVGVNWSCKLMSLKCGYLNNEGKCSIVNWVKALDYAVDKNVRVSNNSYGGGNYSDVEYEAIQAARDTVGHVYCVAAGNDGKDIDQSPTYPASYDLNNMITVAAIGSNDKLASFSNWGAKSVDIAAPGVDIWSTIDGSGYGKKNGTSMATPHVAGAVALTMARYDGTYKEIISRIVNGRRYVGNLDGKVASNGALQCAQALSVWVYFGYSGWEAGTLAHPYNSFEDGLAYTPPSGVLNLYSGSTPWKGEIKKAMTIQAIGGSVVIGQ